MKVVCPRCDTTMQLCGYDQKDTQQIESNAQEVTVEYTSFHRYVCPLCDKKMSVNMGRVRNTLQRCGTIAR